MLRHKSYHLFVFYFNYLLYFDNIWIVCWLYFYLETGSGILFHDSFYRYVLEPELDFTADSSSATGPCALFQDMPQKALLTLGMDPPESWLVESVKTAHDLDNIIMGEVAHRFNYFDNADFGQWL